MKTALSAPEPQDGNMTYNCRGCGATLKTTFADLGRSPPSNEFKTEVELGLAESTYPLRAYVCDKCFLVQLPNHIYPGKMFNENYAYFTSVVPSAVAHAKKYVEEITERFKLDTGSFVVEIGGNDGYLLQHFNGPKIQNIEPSASVAKVSRDKGIPTAEYFFNARTAAELVETRGRADLIHGANVLAHTPDLHGFIEGLRILLEPQGTITLEFPWLKNLIEQTQLDTIYHEHYSYLSLTSLTPILREHKLRVYWVQRLPTLGGSLRLFVCHQGAPFDIHSSVFELIHDEYEARLNVIGTYTAFAEKCVRVKLSLLEFLIQAKRNGCRVAGYGAPAKATTLLNYCGIGSELLPYVVDMTPAKIGKFIPGVQIPIYDPEAQGLRYPAEWNGLGPTHYLILAWNLAKVIRAKIPRNITAVVPIPTTHIIDSDLNIQPMERAYAEPPENWA